MYRKRQNTNINTNSPQLHHSKAAGNGGFLCISNGFRLFTFIMNMTEITSFFKKCCQNVVTK